MSSASRVAYLSAAAAAVAAVAFATSAGAVGGNLPNGGFPQPQPGTANLLNLSGGAHFILAYSSLEGWFYEPTTAAAYAMAPYGIALDGVTILPNPTTTSTSTGTTTTTAPPPTTTTSGSGSGGSGGSGGGGTSGGTTSGGTGGSGGTTSGSGGTTLSAPLSSPTGP